jgi:Domain of unknown function (DUF3291)
MMFVSLTRLRIRSIRFLPSFFFHALSVLKQTKKAPGFQYGGLLPDREWTFWTMTAWDSPESMRQYMTTGSHKAAMPRLLDWCDEASVAHWQQEETDLPSWTDADKRMRQEGRVSKVRYPSPHHADLSYRAPRTTGAASIQRTG